MADVKVVRFGCKCCVGIVLGPEKQLLLKYSEDSRDGMRMAFGDCIKACSLTDDVTELSDVEVEKLVDRLNHQLALGQKFSQVQALLGVEVKR